MYFLPHTFLPAVPPPTSDNPHSIVDLFSNPNPMSSTKHQTNATFFLPKILPRISNRSWLPNLRIAVCISICNPIIPFHADNKLLMEILLSSSINYDRDSLYQLLKSGWCLIIKTSSMSLSGTLNKNRSHN